MRIYVSSMAHPKRLAKRLSKKLGISLNRSQFACSVMLGYKDWHELEQVTDAHLSPPSKPDWLLPIEIRTTRRDAFAVHLQRVLEHPIAKDWAAIWSLIDELDPTGTIPDEVSFFDPRINDIFPVNWSLDEDATAFFDDMPSTPICVSVGLTGSREFETQIRQAVCESNTPRSNAYLLDDRFGYRTFIVDFDNREDYTDFTPQAPGVALIPIRFIPTITENVLLEIELSVHPVALASYHLDDEDTSLIADAIVSYLRGSRIWASSTGIVCGATNGIILTLSGHVTKAPILRIMECLKDKFGQHNDAFDPDEEFNSESKLFLPIREFVDELEIEVPENEATNDFITQHSGEIVDGLLRETKALSKLPQLLERILTSNGFSQYAEFCTGMSMQSHAQRQKLSAFICSMERAKALPRHVSLLFRHHLVDLLIGEYERSHGITPENSDEEYGKYGCLNNAVVATMARSLGDEELACLIEQDYEEVIATLGEAISDIEDLIEEFSQA